MYLILKDSYNKAIVQNGHDDVVEQCYEIVWEENLQMLLEKKHNEGWIIGNVKKSYDDHYDTSYYELFFDKPRDGNIKRECVATIDTQESLVDFLQQRVAPGYNIDMTWCGWDGKTVEDIRARRKRIEELFLTNNNNTSFIEILGGLVNKVTEIVDYSKGGTGSVGSADTNESGESSYSGSSSSSKISSGKSSSNKASGNEASNKNRDSNSYSNYESQLIKMNTYHESQYDDSQRRSIQQKMKSIRTKWEGKGYKMFRSQWEDWDGRKK